MTATAITAPAIATPRIWLAVGPLFLAQALSHLDRFLPSLLIKPIKAGLGLSNFRVGLLLGPAAAVFYCTMALPAGYLADRYSRRRLLASAIAIWCLMTVLAALPTASACSCSRGLAWGWAKRPLPLVRCP